MIVLVAVGLGYTVDDQIDYQRIPNPEILIAETERQLVRIDSPKVASVILIHFKGQHSNPYHYAIVTSPGYMIHADASRRKVVEHGITDGWQDRIHSAYDFPGVID